MSAKFPGGEQDLFLARSLSASIDSILFFISVSTICAPNATHTVTSLWNSDDHHFVKLHQMTYNCVQKKQNSALSYHVTKISTLHAYPS